MYNYRNVNVWTELYEQDYSQRKVSQLELVSWMRYRIAIYMSLNCM